MARPRKPVSEHKKNGTYQASRHGDDTLPVAAPPMPADLRPKAQAFWKVIVANLKYAGLISKIDGQQLRIAADSWEHYLDAEEDLRENGIVMDEIRGTNNNQYTVRKRNPAWDVRAAAWKEITSVLTKFGLSPAARTSLTTHVDDPNDEESQVAKILKFG